MMSAGYSNPVKAEWDSGTDNYSPVLIKSSVVSVYFNEQQQRIVEHFLNPIKS